MVIKRLPELAHGMAERFLTAVAFTPHFVKQGLARNEFAGSPGKAKQDFGRGRRQMSCAVLTRDLSFKGLNEPVTEVEAVQVVGAHVTSSRAWCGTA